MTYTTVATLFSERDYGILRGLFESRVMTVKHMASIYFHGSLDAARKRIWKLKNAGLIRERTRDRPYDPSILHLTRKGFELLQSQQRLGDYPRINWMAMKKRTEVSPLTLQHELEVMTVKAALCEAVQATTTLKIAEFSTWPRLFTFLSRTTTSQGYGKKAWTKPDGFIRLREIDKDGFEDTEHLFYLELDRSTEALSCLQSKVGAYVDHYRSGGMAQKFAPPVEAYENFPFRVLIVCRTEARRDNIAAALLARRPPVLTMVWLTTLDQLCRRPLDAVWVRPVDYRDATQRDATSVRTLIVLAPQG